MRGSRLLQWGASTPWAILPESLAHMVDIVSREKLSLEDIQTISAKMGKPLDNAKDVMMRDGCAVISVIGPIFRYGDMFAQISGATTTEQLALDYTEAMNNPAVKSVIFFMDSPGGEANGIGELASLIATTKTKPVVAYAGGQCCSAAYWIAAAADELIISSTAAVGSIGAVMTAKNPNAVKDGEPLQFVARQSPKKRPNLATDAGKQIMQNKVDMLAEVFIENVAQLRGLSVDQIEAMEGDYFIGKQALDLGLADKMGTLEGVIASLNAPKKEGPMATNIFAKFSEMFAQAAQEVEPAMSATMLPPTPPAVDMNMLKELESLRAKTAKLEEEKLQTAATSFAKDVVMSGKALPAEQDDLIQAYLDAAMDDIKFGPLALTEGITATRLSRVMDRTNRRPAHTLVTPTVPSTLTVLPNVTESTHANSGPSEEEKKERRIKLLSHTEEGRELLKAEGLIK